MVIGPEGVVNGQALTTAYADLENWGCGRSASISCGWCGGLPARVSRLALSGRLSWPLPGRLGGEGGRDWRARALCGRTVTIGCLLTRGESAALGRSLVGECGRMLLGGWRGGGFSALRDWTDTDPIWMASAWRRSTMSAHGRSATTSAKSTPASTGGLSPIWKASAMCTMSIRTVQVTGPTWGVRSLLSA